MTIDRRSTLMLALAASLGVVGSRVRAATRTLRVEDFGAVGDGATDDTRAFQSVGRAVSMAGGGTILLRRDATYRIGVQTRDEHGSYHPQPMLAIDGVSGLTIIGNGATLKLNDGLRYGSFDPSTGIRFDPPPGPFAAPEYGANIGAMIEITRSHGLHIIDLTIDGNMPRLEVGGRWSTDIQLRAVGLQLTEVSDVIVERVVCRDHGLDGAYLRGLGRHAGATADRITFRDVTCSGNGRQGLSIVGGTGLSFQRCRFVDTAQGRIASRPSAGIDIEPNGHDVAADLRFTDCEFTNNRGAGLLADQGASSDIVAHGCVFWQGFASTPGRTRGSGDAFWLNKDGVRIEDCQVHGAVSNLAASAIVTGTHFDDAAHPRYGRAGQTRPYLLAGAAGSFIDCDFIVTAGGKGLVYLTKAATLRDCRLSADGACMPKGRAIAVLGGGATVSDTSFSGSAASGCAPNFVYANDVAVGGRVTVAGGMRWGAGAGRTGVIPPTPPRGPERYVIGL